MTCYFSNNFQRAFGTFPLKQQALTDALNCAIDNGYRAIDTAQMYQNESETGQCIKASGIARDDFLITTKVQPSNFDENLFLPSVELSLKSLQVDSVDVLLLHWPPGSGDIKPSLKLLNAAADEGFARHIGISNYNSKMMRDALHIAAEETGIPLSSYCSVARGAVFKQPLFDELAATYNKTAGQIVLKWIVQQGVSVNTMSTNPVNIKNNYNIMDFELSAEDMTRISALTLQNYRIVDKTLVPWAPDWD